MQSIEKGKHEKAASSPARDATLILVNVLLLIETGPAELPDSEHVRHTEAGHMVPCEGM